MRRAALAVVSTVAGLVLLLGFKSHDVTRVTTPPAAISKAATPSSATTTPAPAAGKSAAATGTRTATGDVVMTRYGPIQVQVTVTNGKVTAASAPTYPDGTPRDQEINSYAVPALNQEAVAAGSANIDVVSGATYTSEGYAQSLQSALDKARA